MCSQVAQGVAQVSRLKLSAPLTDCTAGRTGGNWQALLGAAAQLALHLHPPPLHCAARGGMINLNLFMIYHRECFAVLFKWSNGWMASHLEKLVLKLMQCGVGREGCCSGIKRPCCRLPPKRRQSFFLLLFFIRHCSGI